MIELQSSVELKKWAASPVVVVFGSYCAAVESQEYGAAEELGSRLAQNGYVVCSGGYEGIMEAVLKGASYGGGKSIGVLTQYFEFINLQPNRWVQACVVARGLIDRIQLFWELGDAYIVLPGSTGTLAELAVSLEMINKSVTASKLLLCMGAYWKPVVDVIATQVRPFHPGETVESLVQFAETPAELVTLLSEKIGSGDVGRAKVAKPRS